MNTHMQLVTFEQAKKLKELGFYLLDNNLQIYYIKDGQGYLRNGENTIWEMDENGEYKQILKPEEWCHATTTAFVLKWLRDTKKILITPFPIDNWDSWNYRILCEDCMSPFFEIPVNNELEFKTYEEAESAGLDYVLDNLLTK